ncbi:oxidoreductase [Arthrobacter castelli]|uniref:oxidoreductase n=1 Tax=Arthrobacter castelli TaxID=271431 RepID=UPI00041B41F9|nr:oxidoreductase [Arthrobacter castelli]
MHTFTPEGIPDLTGKRAIVTGANSGLGLQTSLALAAKGASVMLACRNPERGQRALEHVAEATGSAVCTTGQLDLASLQSVRSFAGAWHGPLDILVNNAGVMATNLRRTEDGFEQQLGINHLGHFALGGLLLAQLRESADARVVTVSSLAHRRGSIDFDDMNSARRYRRWGAYGQSKIANLYYTVELNRRLAANGDTVTVAAAHPGLSRTGLFTGGGRITAEMMASLVQLIGQPVSAGALPILYAAASPHVHGGDFYGPDGAGGLRGRVTLSAPVQQVLDEETGRRLWEHSEEMTGVQYDGLSALSDGG